jgi:phospho-N-acetylmuramoyl-pentapeptide-transferase
MMAGFPRLSGLLAQVAAPGPDAAALIQVPPLPTEVMIRSLVIGAIAFGIGLLIGRPIINWLRDHKIGKQIRIEGPQTHMVKMGTPTMGGMIFLITIGLVMTAFLLFYRGAPGGPAPGEEFLSLLLPLGITLSCGILGAVDDYLSLSGRSKGGMTARFKMVWLILIGLIAALIMRYALQLKPVVYIPFTGVTIDIGDWYILVVVVVIVGFANAVNFTDGLDTLAGGTVAVAFAAYGIIAYLQRQEPVVPLCFCVVGALLAFLWYNAHPALVIMGDAGALALGALLATCAFMTGQWLLLPVIGIVFVGETLAVILQVLYFRLTGGKRLFKMSPLHHHFEMLGWSEPQVTLRFWLVGMCGAMLGVALALA